MDAWKNLKFSNAVVLLKWTQINAVSLAVLDSKEDMQQ